MTDFEIEARIEILVHQERAITREILHLINLAEDRRLYLSAGGSLVRWLVARFGYSETAAVRRVQSARMLRAVPAVEQKIQSGEVNLTTLAKAQSVLRAEEKRTGERVSPERKAAVAEAIEGQSLRDTERTLAGLFPEAVEQATQEKVRMVANDEVRVSLTFPQEAWELVEKVRLSLGHALPEAGLAGVIAHVFADYWKRKDPARVTARKGEPGAVRASDQGTSGESTCATAPVAQSAAERRRQVFRRAGSRCEHVDPGNGRKCGSQVRLEVDHIHPRSLGGNDDLDNLRLLCRAHNQGRAEKSFGRFRSGRREEPIRRSSHGTGPLRSRAPAAG